MAYPLVYFKDTVIQPFLDKKNILDFLYARPNIVIFHDYFFLEQPNIPSSLELINNFVNMQWRNEFPDVSSSLPIEIKLYDPINPNLRGGTILLEELPVSPDAPITENTNQHLIYTLQVLFSFSPYANITIFSTTSKKGYETPIFLFNELQKPFYYENQYVFFTNVGLESYVPPTPNFQNIFQDIKIPIFYAVGNDGWSLDNYVVYEKKTYDLLWFTSDYCCAIGNYSSTKSSCAFLDPSLIYKPECPTEIVSDRPSLWTSFLRFCTFAKSFIPSDYNLPVPYKVPYNVNLPEKYKNQFRVPDVTEQGNFLLVNSFNIPVLQSGSSLSVITFTMAYNILRSLFPTDFVIKDSSSSILSSTFLQKFYLFQDTNIVLFRYFFQYLDQPDACQYVYIPTDIVPLDPPNINCPYFPQYIIKEEPSQVGLNVQGLGVPIWKNWVL